MTKKNKSFDAVKFMRERRAELSELYWKDPEEFKRRMREAGKKLRELKKDKSRKQKSKA